MTLVYSFPFATPDSLASVTEQIGPLVGMVVVSKPWLVAIDGQDTFAYARAAAAATSAPAEGAGGEDGSTSDGPCALFNSTANKHTLQAFQFLTVSHAPAQPLQTPPAGSYSNLQTRSQGFVTNFTRHARLLADHLKPNSLPRYNRPPSACLPSADVIVTQVANTATQILEDLRTLAAWPRLRDPTLPDPIVGDLESDPAGIADRLGVKGLSVYTAFIEMDSLQCRACGHQSGETALAILHQRHRRHFQD